MKKILIIGYGAMAKLIVPLLPETVQVSGIIATERSIEKVKKIVGKNIQVVTSVADIYETPDLVIEMAGPDGLKAHGPAILEKGWDLGVISVGAFTDDSLTKQFQKTAQQSGAKVHILAGAIAGIDGIAAAKIMGLDNVLYEGRKHPRSWAGSHAESLCDLQNLTKVTVFFEGTAREAARLFPANANVAATLALAGIGLDETKVQLIADPSISKNQHKVYASGPFGELTLDIAGNPLKDNPKTSTLAALSVVRLCLNQDDVFVI